MPPRRMRVVPITTVSPSRTFATPVMSGAAIASDGSAIAENMTGNRAGRIFRIMLTVPDEMSESYIQGARLWCGFGRQASAAGSTSVQLHANANHLRHLTRIENLQPLRQGLSVD